MEPLFRAILLLKTAGVTGIGAYHARGVAPLTRRSLTLDAMVDGADMTGTVLRGGAPSNAVVLARLRDAFADPVEAYPIAGHPPMHPAPGAVQVVRVPLNPFCFVFFILLSAGSDPCPPSGRSRSCLAAARSR